MDPFLEEGLVFVERFEIAKENHQTSGNKSSESVRKSAGLSRKENMSCSAVYSLL